MRTYCTIEVSKTTNTSVDISDIMTIEPKSRAVEVSFVYDYDTRLTTIMKKEDDWLFMARDHSGFHCHWI
jgi:hypothetical protein